MDFSRISEINSLLLEDHEILRTLQGIYCRITHFVLLAIHIFDHEIENDNQNQIAIQPIPQQDVQNITQRRYPLRDRKKTEFYGIN